jgi:hypothetical protein
MLFCECGGALSISNDVEQKRAVQTYTFIRFLTADDYKGSSHVDMYFSRSYTHWDVRHPSGGDNFKKMG